MHLLLMCALTVMAAAQPFCDPETQYELNGKCCKMCGPGTSKSSTGTCEEPQCKVCGENEYQETYTKEFQCHRQPYCDTNKNFESAVHDTKKQTVCMCKRGFHCSSESCLTCVPHTNCPQGHGAKSIGNHTHNTVCQECPKGTFSQESSWDSVCKKWTECGKDYHIKEGGTSTTDNICEENSRMHISFHLIWIFCLVLLAVGLVCYIYKGKHGNAEGTFKNCFKPCCAENMERLTDVSIIANPTDNPEVDSMLQPTGERHSTPEENEDDQSVDRSICVGLTANGQCVQQEMGKTEQLSRQESQMDTLITESSLQQ